MFIDAAKNNVPNYKMFHRKKKKVIIKNNTKTKTEKSTIGQIEKVIDRPTQTPLCGFAVAARELSKFCSGELLKELLKFCSDEHVFERFSFFL